MSLAGSAVVRGARVDRVKGGRLARRRWRFTLDTFRPGGMLWLPGA